MSDPPKTYDSILTARTVSLVEAIDAAGDDLTSDTHAGVIGSALATFIVRRNEKHEPHIAAVHAGSLHSRVLLSLALYARQVEIAQAEAAGETMQ